MKYYNAFSESPTIMALCEFNCSSRTIELFEDNISTKSNQVTRNNHLGICLHNDSRILNILNVVWMKNTTYQYLTEILIE